MGLTTTFFMMVTEDDTTQLLLDFASIEFVTNIDNLVFWLGAWGYLGVNVQIAAGKICNAKNPVIIPTTRQQASSRGRAQKEEGGTLQQDHDGTCNTEVKRDLREDTVRTLTVKFSQDYTSNDDDDGEEKLNNATVGPVVEGDNNNKDGKKATKRKEDNRRRRRLIPKRASRCLFLVIIFLIMLCGWGVVFYRQKTGYYVCQTVHVQFNDDYSPKLATFSGLYDRCDVNYHSSCQIGHYIERGHGFYKNAARFGYCRSEKAWAFSHDVRRTTTNTDGSGNNDNNEHEQQHDICNWSAKSSRIDPFEGEAYNIIGSSHVSWFTINEDTGSTVPLPTFSLKCFDCKNDENFCGGRDRGECVNNQCVCKEGWYGNRCEYHEPCEELEIDPLHPSFQGGREYAESFQRLNRKNNNNDDDGSSPTRTGGDDGINIYDRPAYIGSSKNGYLDLIFYNGRRWAMISGTSRSMEGLSRDDVIDMLQGFHAYWSDYTVSFLSSPVDVDTPKDAVTPVGLTWFPADQTTEEDDHGATQFPHLNRPSDTRLLCTICTNETSQNTCSYGGICGDDGRCQCTKGSSGRLCQIAPVGNGLCNQFFNTPEFDYDGGDCCEETCVSREHDCGKGVIGKEFGVEAYGYIGYEDCSDPTLTKKVSGSFECRGMKICVLGDSTWYDVTIGVFPEYIVIEVPSFSDVILGLESGLCNVVAGLQGDVEGATIRQGGFTGAEYEMGSTLYTKSFETWLTPPNDRVWSKFVSWVLEALVEAEESGITKETANRMGTTNVFGPEFENIFRDAVRANGNYGEIWNQTTSFSRAGLNSLNDGSTGLLLSKPFGNVNNQGPAPRAGGTIEAILQRGHLIIGIPWQTKGFGNLDGSTWSGMFYDFGRAISAALFQGEVKLEILPVTSFTRFAALAGGAVDVVVGPTRNLSREMKEPVTGEAFDFSSPIYYDGLSFAGLMPYGRCADGLQFGGHVELGDDCQNTIICASEGTTWLEVMRNKLRVPEQNILVTLGWDEAISKFYSGECNVMAHESFVFDNIPEELQPFYYGINKHTKEPLAVMSRSDDSQFSDLLRWIVYGIIYAEEQGITQGNSNKMPETNLFGEDLTGILRDSIKAVGNYADIYHRNLDGLFVRTPPNTLNDLSSPQLYANPGTV